MPASRLSRKTPNLVSERDSKSTRRLHIAVFARFKLEVALDSRQIGCHIAPVEA